MNCMNSYSLRRLLFKLLLLSSCSFSVAMCVSTMSRFGVVHSSFIGTSTMTKRLFFSSPAKFANNMDDTTDIDDDYPTIRTLLQRAQRGRQRIDDDTFIHDSSKLSYPLTSAYNMKAIESKVVTEI